MKRASNSISTQRFLLRTTIASSISMGLLCASLAYADTPVTLTPPISQGGASAATINQADVFNWSQVPKNQTVIIARATFDKGGYQLYDTSGEIILVPFVNNNLYVMKFAKSTDGSMYFVNEGSTPVLYVPEGGYLENATVPGARWYPITADFAPTKPVDMGIAPSYDDYIDMGFYTDTTCDGGYYQSTGAGSGTPVACPGSGITVNGTKCHGWKDYRKYCNNHPPPFHIVYSNPGVYQRPVTTDHHFPVNVQLHPLAGDHPVNKTHDTDNKTRTFDSQHGVSGNRPLGVGDSRSTPETARIEKKQPLDIVDHSNPQISIPKGDDHISNPQISMPRRDDPINSPQPPPVVNDRPNPIEPPQRVFEDHSNVAVNTPIPAPPPVIEERHDTPPPVIEERHDAPSPVIEQHIDVPAPPPVFEQHVDAPAPPPVIEQHVDAPAPPPAAQPDPQPGPSIPNNPPPTFSPPSFNPGEMGGEHSFGGRR